MKLRTICSGFAAMALALAGCSENVVEGGGDAVAQSSPPSVGLLERTPMANEDFDYEAYLAILQEAMRNISRLTEFPETELVRVIAPEDQPIVWKECMTTAGFAVVTTQDGGLGPPPDLPADQWPAFDLADYTCHAQFPVDQTMFRTFGDEQIETLFHYYVDVLTPCLEERGFIVTEPPTWEAFRSMWVEDGRGGFYASRDVWYPYMSIDPFAMTPGEEESLNRACPQSPPDDLLWPDG